MYICVCYLWIAKPYPLLNLSAVRFGFFEGGSDTTLVFTVRVWCTAPNLASDCIGCVYNAPSSNSLIRVGESEDDGSHVIFPHIQAKPPTYN